MGNGFNRCPLSLVKKPIEKFEKVIKIFSVN